MSKKSPIPRKITPIEYPDTVPQPPDWTFGSRLKYVMYIRDINCNELAAKIGVEASTLSGYRTDYHLPSLEIIADIAQALNVTADYLIGIRNTPVMLTPSDTHQNI